MDEAPKGLLDQVVNLSTNTGKVTAAAFGYHRMLTSIVEDLGVSSASSTSSLDSSSDDDNSEQVGNNNNSENKSSSGSNTKATTAANILATTDWLWSSSAATATSLSSSSFKKLQYSTNNGLDKELGLPLFTLQDVSLHDMPHDCWIVLYDRVYDITCFLNSHPGGDEIMLEYAGLDATLPFRGVGHSKEAEDSLKPYLIGILVESERIWTRFFNMKSDVP